MQEKNDRERLRKSLRKVAGVDYSRFYDPGGYPEGKPANAIEQRFYRLNREAFNHERLSQLDDILVFTLFDTKKQSGRARALHNHCTSGTNLISCEEGRIMFRVLEMVDKENPTRDQCVEAVNQLVRMFGEHFRSKDVDILTHQLERYMLLYSKSSPVVLEKVSFDGKHVSAGLRARTPIPGLTYILHTSGSMSSDLWPRDGGHSVIHSSNKQLGPKGVRLILGPFRFGNHDCEPNCQIRPIEKSHAYVYFTLRDIEAGESLTIRYSKDGYIHGECLCATCQPDKPPVAPRPERALNFTKGVKKKHRAGQRRTRRAIEKS